MNLKYLFGMLLFLPCIIPLAGCEEEEDDFLSGPTENSTVIEGTVCTAGGQPLEGVDLQVNYYEGAWMQYPLVRHKAKAQTNKRGSYKLEFYVKDDEGQKEDAINRYFTLMVDIAGLDPDEYIFPGDMVSQISPGDPPAVGPATDIEPVIRYHLSPERNRTYTHHVYIPRKRYVPITLKGFIPRQPDDRFEVSTYFPWGEKDDEEEETPAVKYNRGHSPSDLYVASAEEQTFDVLCALNENNIVRLTKIKDGVVVTEEYRLFVTEDSPAGLTYEY